MWKWINAPSSPLMARWLGARSNGEVLIKAGAPVAANVVASMIAWLSWVTILLLLATICWFAWTARSKAENEDRNGASRATRPLYPRGRWVCLAAAVLFMATGISAAVWRLQRGDHPLLTAMSADLQATRANTEDIKMQLTDVKRLVASLVATLPAEIHGAGEGAGAIESAVHRAAAQPNDPVAQQALDQLRSANDPRALLAFLDEQIQRNPLDPIELHRERAWVAFATGDTRKAEASFRSILALQPNDYDAMLGASFVCQRRGEYAMAESFQRQALALPGVDEQQRAFCFHNLGNTLINRGDIDGAEALYRKAIAMLNDLGLEDDAALTTANLGMLFLERGDLDTATRLLESARHVHEASGNRLAIASVLHSLGNIADLRLEFDRAESLYNQSLTIYEGLSDAQGIASCYTGLGNINKARGLFTTAERYCRKALEIHESLGHRAGVSACLTNLAGIAVAQEEFSAAEQLLQRAVDIDQEIGNLAGLALSWRNLALIYDIQNDISSARLAYELSRDIYLQMGHREAADEVQSWLDKLPDN